MDSSLPSDYDGSLSSREYVYYVTMTTQLPWQFYSHDTLTSAVPTTTNMKTAVPITAEKATPKSQYYIKDLDSNDQASSSVN